MAENYLKIVEAARARYDGTKEKSEPSFPFIGKPAKVWLEEAAKTPVAKMLFDQFWFEGELCVLFASTNTGKSILAVQIANFIASGIFNSNWRITTSPQKVLYFDFELSMRQFTRRYSIVANERYTSLFPFPDDFIRYELGDVEVPEDISLSEYYIQSIRREVRAQKAFIVVIDNITWINSKLEKSADAGAFMQSLNKLKREEELSILIIAHTPKRDASQPITINDLAGSAQLMNFMDSAFAIGLSNKDPQLRYLKQIKVRECEKVYGEDKVMICMLDKVSNFLKFIFHGYERERDHLRQYADKDKKQRDADILELYEELSSYRKVGKQLGVSHQTVKRVVERAGQDAKNGDDDDDLPF
jgi:RecA-family ATPase